MISELVDLINLPLLYVFGKRPRQTSVDPDQTPQNAASDKGQPCLPLSSNFPYIYR